MVTPVGVISTIAGNTVPRSGDGICGYSGDGGPATSAQLAFPQGVAVNTAGNLYIADTDNSRIRRVSAIEVPVTITTNPPGRSFSADGTTYTSPQTFNWVPGSTHTIETTTPQVSSGARFIFSNWSDGGAISHTITVPASATTYTANFKTQYLLTTAAAPGAGGSISANPASADGFYNSGTSVQLTATANGGYTFAGFSGDVTALTNPQSVVMSAPRSVTANFTVARRLLTTATLRPVAGRSAGSPSRQTAITTRERTWS